MTDITGPPALVGFRFLRKIGDGGFAQVFLYEEERSGLNVAVKVLNAEGLTNEMREQFTAEVDAMTKLAHHPNIVQVFPGATVAPDGRPYIIMKYYDGDNYALRSKRQRLSVADVLRTGIQLASAVETAHRANILHRDIKPANILSDRYGASALTDFGIAAIGTGDGEGPDGLSPPWAPPEVVFGTAPADERSDVYSLGATLWHLLVGRSPFEEPGGDNSTGLMRRIKTMPPPSTGRGDVPPSLERLLQVAMAKQPENRPRTALEFARSLQSIEQEKHLPMTPLQLLEAADDGASARSQGAGDTRVRAPQRVDAQPAAPPAGETMRRRLSGDRGLIGKVEVETPPAVAVEGARGGARAPRERVAPPLPAPAAETRRPPRRVSADEAVVAPGPLMAKSRRRWLIAALVVVVAVAAGGAVLLSGGKKDAGATRASPSVVVPATPPEEVVSAPPPGTPTVRAAAGTGFAVFRWSGYANELASDSFRWRQSGSGVAKHGVVKEPTLRVTLPKGGEACLAVQVVRDDGSGFSHFSDVTCSTVRAVAAVATRSTSVVRRTVSWSKGLATSVTGVESAHVNW